MQKNPIINLAYSIVRVSQKIQTKLKQIESVNGVRIYKQSKAYTARVDQIVAMITALDEKSKDEDFLKEAKGMNSEVLDKIELVRALYIPTKKKKESKK